MKFSHGLAAMMAGAALLGGCAQTRTVKTTAIAPTAEEAKQLAKAQLDQQVMDLQTSGGGYRAAGSPHFTTKMTKQADGGTLYEVTGSEQAVKGK